MSFLFDASSIFEALVERKVRALQGNYTIDLAMYEVGNILWKRRCLLKDVDDEEIAQLIGLIKRVLRLLKTVKIDCHEREVVDVAVRFKVTFYDASYVFAAKNNNLTLVTEDEKLRRKVKGYVDVLSLREI